MFAWHQPDGKEPQWELPDLFHKFPQFDTDPNAYYRPYPEFSSRAEHEPVHPQIVAENGPDSAHFHYVHGATVTPVCLNWEAVDEEWRFLTGWPDVRSDDPNKMALYIHSHFFGLGFAISAFEGSSNHRLIFACTPVEDGYSDMFYSIWWPSPGDTSTCRPTVREQVERQFLGTVWEDLDIWRYQEYIEIRAGQDRRETLYGHAEVGDAVLRRAPTPRSRPRETGPRRDRGPGHTAIVTQECQGAVVGPNAGLAVLAEEARREAVPNIERLLPAARDAGVKVVHCLVQRRPDGLGGNQNAKIFAIGSGVDIAPGSPGASLLPELGPAPTDVVLRRSHGIGPMGGTDLDATLRNLGVSTIVAVGVSVNVAITNLVMDAVNLAYRVVVPRDAVAGIPADYATSIIDNTLSLLATITTTDDLIEVWKQS